MSTPKQNFSAVVAIVLGCLVTAQAHAQFERDPEAVAAFEAGEMAREAEDWETAIVEYSKATTIDSTFTEAHFGRAEALRETEDFQNAITSYQKSLDIDPNNAVAYNGRGICFREMGDLNLALNDFQNAAELDRGDADIAANLGDILVNNAQNPTEAMQYLDRAIEHDPENAEAYRNRGWAHTLLRQFEDGIVDLKKAIELDPEDYETYQRLASVHLVEEEHQKGIDALTLAIQYYEPEESADPDTYINGYLQRAAARTTFAKQESTTPELRKQLYAEVVADADAVLEEFPDRFPESGIAMYRRGMALRMQGLFGEAITAFTDAIQLIPPGNDASYTGEAYLTRGICWFYQGQNDLARGDFQEAATQSLTDPLPHLWIGFTYAEEKEYRKAIESYGEATSKAPAFPRAHVNRGLAYMQLKDYEKAIKNFNEAIRAEPTEPTHFYKCGYAYEKLEQWQKAFSFYELALLRDGNLKEANQGAARALEALGRPGLSNQYKSRVN